MVLSAVPYIFPCGYPNPTTEGYVNYLEGSSADEAFRLQTRQQRSSFSMKLLRKRRKYSHAIPQLSLLKALQEPKAWLETFFNFGATLEVPPITRPFEPVPSKTQVLERRDVLMSWGSSIWTTECILFTLSQDSQYELRNWLRRMSQHLTMWSEYIVGGDHLGFKVQVLQVLVLRVMYFPVWSFCLLPCFSPTLLLSI